VRLAFVIFLRPSSYRWISVQLRKDWKITTMENPKSVSRTLMHCSSIATLSTRISTDPPSGSPILPHASPDNVRSSRHRVQVTSIGRLRFSNMECRHFRYPPTFESKSIDLEAGGHYFTKHKRWLPRLQSLSCITFIGVKFHFLRWVLSTTHQLDIFWISKSKNPCRRHSPRKLGISNECSG
jgi:hypothetical protein